MPAIDPFRTFAPGPLPTHNGHSRATAAENLTAVVAHEARISAISKSPAGSRYPDQCPHSAPF